jgi:hypothetical protein
VVVRQVTATAAAATAAAATATAGFERGSYGAPPAIKMLRKTAFLSHLYIKTNILPRQARDKHRENSKTMPFSQVFLISGFILLFGVSELCLPPSAATRFDSTPPAAFVQRPTQDCFSLSA